MDCEINNDFLQKSNFLYKMLGRVSVALSIKFIHNTKNIQIWFVVKRWSTIKKSNKKSQQFCENTHLLHCRFIKRQLKTLPICRNLTLKFQKPIKILTNILCKVLFPLLGKTPLPHSFQNRGDICTTLRRQLCE